MLTCALLFGSLYFVTDDWAQPVAVSNIEIVQASDEFMKRWPRYIAIRGARVQRGFTASQTALDITSIATIERSCRDAAVDGQVNE